MIDGWDSRRFGGDESCVRYVLGDGDSRSLASPRHAEEGCTILMFVLCEFARMLERDTGHDCLAES